jgi:hypothetical protein
MDVDADKVEATLATIATTIGRRFAQSSNDIWLYLLEQIPDLRGDELLERLLSASVEENVGTMVHVLEHRMSLDNIAAPLAAAEYARRLAQRGISVIALVRAYRVGHARFLHQFLKELALQSIDPQLNNEVTDRLLTLTFAYIDRVSEQVVGAYQQERDHWLLTQATVRTAQAHRVLDGDTIDVGASEVALGYRLRQNHLAMVGWVPEPTTNGEGLVRLDRLGLALAAELGCRGRHLLVPHDETLAWLWLPLGDAHDVDWAMLEQFVEAHDPTVHIGVGEIGTGVEGFRSSHYQAVGAHAVSLAARPPRRVTFSKRLGFVPLICTDLRSARIWVSSALGHLAANEPTRQRLRNTLRVFLEKGGSYTNAAEALNMHRNTVQYRVQKAQDLLPRPLAENRSEVEMALRACDQLGTTLLTSTAPTEV